MPAHQVRWPQSLAGPDSSAQSRLKQVVASCLHAAPSQRSTAAQVKASLHAIMQQQGWSDDLTEQPLCSTTAACST